MGLVRKGRGGRPTLEEWGITAGELGSAAGQTVVVALLPVLLARYAPSTALIGLAIGAEGLFAMLIPFWVGALGDRLPRHAARRVGRRMPFMLASAVVMALALALFPYLRSYWALLVAGMAFSAALHAYMTPLSALVVEAVPPERRGRVQGLRGSLRSLGLGYGLGAAGLLFALTPALPFLVGSALVLLTTAITWRSERRARHTTPLERQWGVRETLRHLKGQRAALWFLLANALWNAAIDGIRPYVFLFTGAVLGLSVADTSLGMLVLIVELGVASLVIGHLGDHVDRGRVLEVGVAALTLALALGFFVRTPLVAMGVLVATGIGIAAILPLPYPLFADLVGGRAAGQYAALFVISIGFGRLVAPLLVGAAIDLGARWLPEQRGYPFMWVVAAAFAAGGWLALRRARRTHHPTPGAPERGQGADTREPLRGAAASATPAPSSP